MVQRVPELLTIDEAAESLRVTRRTIERLIARGELERVNVARTVRITRSSLDAYIAEHTTPPRSARRPRKGR
jgi:excisionase family DNA binding protein